MRNAKNVKDVKCLLCGLPPVYMYVTVNTTNSVSDVLCQVDFVFSGMYLNSQC